MSKTLATFMIMAAVVIFMSVLVLGIVFPALENKNNLHEDILQTKHQLKINP